MFKLKVLSYWNLNKANTVKIAYTVFLKVLSYWNLNKKRARFTQRTNNLKYYHIGI